MRNVLYLLFLLAATAGADVTGNGSAPTGHAAPPTRALGLEGAPNFRDIGGYAAKGGKHVRWGRVYRSSELSHLTSADAARVDGLNLSAVIDLRAQDEREKSPSRWARRPSDIYVSPKESLAPVMQGLMHDAQTADGARASIEAFYAKMPDSYHDEYAALFHRIAAGELPLLVHCSAGKDRTGVAVAVLLASIGVSRTAIIGDYALTEKLVPALPMTPHPAAGVAAVSQASQVLAPIPEESRRVLWRSDPEYVAAALSSIDREYGSVDNYVRRGLGISDAELSAVRKALLD